MKKSSGCVVVLTSGARRSVTNEFPEALRFLQQRGYACRNIVVAGPRPAKLGLNMLRLAPVLRDAELVVTDNYVMAALTSAVLRVTRARARHVVVGLNFSGNRPIKFRWQALDRVMNWAFFGRIDMAIVASRPEAEIFARDYGIPRDRFAFIHWAYDLPQLEGRFERGERPYFTMIGRNNRDHRTFCKALEMIDADGVIISQFPPDFDLPANVRSLLNAPLGDCIACIRGSVANVLLVKDADRGAGHITIVTAMHCARPQIISHVDTALDYFLPGRHALTVPLSDVGAVREAMQALLDDPAMANDMGRSAAEFAALYLSHARRVQLLEDRIRTWFDTGRVEWIAPE